MTLDLFQPLGDFTNKYSRHYDLQQNRRDPSIRIIKYILLGLTQKSQLNLLSTATNIPCLFYLSFNKALQYIRQMGQQDSKPQAPNLKYSRRVPQAYKPPRTLTNSTPFRPNFEGLLKLQTTPFKNSIEIQTQTEILFLQQIDITLKQLLDDRLNTNKLFLIEDIERLIETLTFTLASLQEHKITYKDISAQNIFYDNSNFKLLPNELIQYDTYHKLKENSDTFPSPELIIALRCGESEIVDDDILEKSNVFTLGMVLLQTTTLLPSSECYDCDNYDILDSVINERVILAEEYYGQKIARAIANMLDYDYTERMNLRDLSIWINRLMAPSRVIDNTHIAHATSTSLLISKSEKNLQAKQSEDKGKSRVKQVKNNSVYMGSANNGDCGRQERNKVYITQAHQQQESSNRFYDVSNSYNIGKKSSPHLENINKSTYDRLVEPNARTSKDRQNLRFNQTTTQSKSLNPYLCSEQYKKTLVKKEGPYDRSLIDPDTVTKRITKEPIRPYRNQPPLQATDSRGGDNSLKDVGNQYYPSIEDVLKTKAVQVKKPIGENGSLNRIKQQILKSRKLIQQFKRSQGLKF